MRIALADLPAEQALHGDIAIVGTGPAGVTLAVELSRSGQRVVLLEAGGDELSEKSQAVYRGTVVGDDYYPLEIARLRFLGGSSNHWAGWCRHLEPIDFEPRPGFPNTGWPIRKSHVDPYLKRARDILELSPLRPDELLDADSGIERIHFNVDPPVRFWSKFGAELEASQNVVLVPDANVTLVRTDGDKVTGLSAEDWSGNTAQIRADRYILATGGIENSRLLLWSNEVQNGALVSPESPTGRFWMEHPHKAIGVGLLPRYQFDRGHSFALSAQEQNRQGILGCGLMLSRMNRGSTRALAEQLATTAPKLGAWAREAIKISPTCGVRLQAAWEQEPVANNRVALSNDERDRFGVPRTELHWRRTETDMRTLKESALALAQYFARHDLGRIRIEPWVLSMTEPEDGIGAGSHHMGGTRMANVSAEGIVDSNCRVFGQNNLFIAGSSIFPTGGHANPTQTIVQLALRLADHLIDLRGG